ncbi:hypothetical protein GCM10007897_06230 [Sphingobium jiangsuense]|uniref:Uncharacterized protein n=1 Tax=Sphingobium jiangsuense TaxID=870476 RepID=A0A7W6BEE2_9SPHN|nr:hypothetical protein [Sphingobium jiangsuense]MBB3925308.1 hypothetical protein [Sphingobium jiangsuense]GLS99244.1 hypothetical protein GCM10007897_06230 [Sphingobium jiangsuense]
MTQQTKDQTKSVPPLLELPVYQEKYCSQAVTDNALSYLWANRPDLVAAQAEVESRNFDNVYIMELAAIVEFFRDEASKHIEIPTTRLGMLDLLFEMSRRLRLALGIPAWEVRGRPLAESENGPMPDLPSYPIETGKGEMGLTQEMADRIIEAAYRAAPHLFFERVECLRRGGIWPYDSIHALAEVIKSTASPNDFNSIKHWGLEYLIRGEITYRLVKSCNINGVIADRVE